MIRSTETTSEVKNMDCPHCKGKIEVEIERKPAKVRFEEKDDSDIRKEIAELKEMVKPKEHAVAPPAKEVKIKEYPSHMPGEICLSGNCEAGGVHRNKNYKLKPAKKCDNCGQFAPKGAKRCAWCKKEEFEDMEDEELEELGIPLPAVQEHDHTHEGE